MRGQTGRLTISKKKGTQARLGLLPGLLDRGPVRPADPFHDVFPLRRGSWQLRSELLRDLVCLHHALTRPTSAAIATTEATTATPIKLHFTL
jgi:hypothetical protein